MISLLVLLLACAAPALLVMLVLYVRLTNRLIAHIEQTEDALDAPADALETACELLDAKAEELRHAKQSPTPIYFETALGYVSYN